MYSQQGPPQLLSEMKKMRSSPVNKSTNAFNNNFYTKHANHYILAP
jgi:hypothetical protein